MPTPKPYTASDGTVTYRVRIRVDGRNTSETFATEREADRFCRRVEDIGPKRAVAERARTDVASDEYVPTLREVYAKRMDTRTGITDGTRRDYDKLANRMILPMFGATRVDLIDADDVARFINRLEKTEALDNKGRPKRDSQGNPTKETLSAKTIATHHALLRGILQTAVEQGWTDRNVAVGTRLPRAGEERRRDNRYLLTHEYQAIEEALPTVRDKALARLMVGAGLRWSEATALQTRHVDFNAGIVRVRQAWKRPSKGGNRKLGPPKSFMSRRDVQTPDLVMDLLRQIVQHDQPDAYVFRNSKGNALHNGSFSSRVWAPACAAAGVLDPRPRIHDLRHTHASWMLNAGATLEEVQEQLGHEDITITRRVYGKLQPEQRRRIRDNANATLGFLPGATPQIGAPAPADS